MSGSQQLPGCDATVRRLGRLHWRTLGLPDLADGTAAFVVYSLGKNASEPTSGAGADEAKNLDNDNVFVSRTASSVTGAEFDHIVLWTSVNALISRLVAAGQLP